MSGTRRLAALVAALVAALAGCTAGTTRPGGTTTTTRTETTTLGSGPPSTAAFTATPATSRAPKPPGHRTSAGEQNGACPYIRTGLQQTANKGVNLAEIIGDRVYRTTRLTDLRPVGCRFYFYAAPYEAIAEIRPQTLANAATARNAMVLTARTGTELIVERNFVEGLDGICFRTHFFGPDRATDWAFVFAKGAVLVTVYTQVTISSRNALYVAQAIAAKF